MAYKKTYAVLALVGICGASGAAWWWQNKPASSDNAAATAAAPGAAASGAGSAGASGAGPAGASGGAPSGAAGGAQGGAPGGAPARPPAVEVAKVQALTLVDETQAVGSLRSRQGVMMRPEVGGRIKSIYFTDGQRVRKGQVMVQFEDQLQQAQLSQAKAELSIAEANHKRNQELVTQNFISKRSLDESAAAL